MQVRDKPPKAGGGVLLELNTEMGDLLKAGKITEIRGGGLVVTPSPIFPKVGPKIKEGGTLGQKARILCDDRKGNRSPASEFTARLGGQRRHIELLEAYAAPAGEECARRVPHQTRKELWNQIKAELQADASGRDLSLNGTEIRDEVKRAMVSLNEPGKTRRLHAKWKGRGALPQTIDAPTTKKGLLAGIVKQNPSAKGLTVDEKAAAAGRLGSAEGVELGTKDYSKAYYQMGTELPSLSQSRPVVGPERGRGVALRHVQRAEHGPKVQRPTVV